MRTLVSSGPLGTTYVPALKEGIVSTSEKLTPMLDFMVHTEGRQEVLS